MPWFGSYRYRSTKRLAKWWNIHNIPYIHVYLFGSATIKVHCFLWAIYWLVWCYKRINKSKCLVYELAIQQLRFSKVVLSLRNSIWINNFIQNMHTTIFRLPRAVCRYGLKYLLHWPDIDHNNITVPTYICRHTAIVSLQENINYLLCTEHWCGLKDFLGKHYYIVYI